MEIAISQRLAGRNVVIAGASGGIGSAIALRLASEGASLVLIARRADRLEALREDLADSKRAIAIPCDLADPKAVSTAVATVGKHFDHVDGLINCVGKEQILPFQSVTNKQLDELALANLYSTLLFTRDIGRLMIHHGHSGGSIVNLTSIAGQVGIPAMSVYGALKSAIVGWTRCLAMEWAGRHIRVNAVAAGLVRTEMFDRITAPLSSVELAKIEQLYPLGFGQPSDVAAAVAYLVSDDARWVTGTVLTLDGGYSAR